MSYVGDDADAAPQLRFYRVDDADEAEALVDQALRAIERMLFLNVVHGDLSPYNLLVWEGQVTVIDLPQAVDPRKNRHAKAFLDRDVERVCDWAAKHGVHRPAGRIANDLWTSWEMADLVPEELRGLTM
jgi:RIO kinase 1